MQDNFTAETSAEYFAMQTKHWEAFVDGFREKREREIDELDQLDYAVGDKSERDYWIKWGRMLAYQQIYRELGEVGAVVEENYAKTKDEE